MRASLPQGRAIRTHLYDVGMPYDESLAARIRELITDQIDDVPVGLDLTERRMFGGLAFMIDGHMSIVASSTGGVMLRVDPADAERLIATTSAYPAEMRGRPMRGWLRVDAGNVRTRRQLEPWVRRGVATSRSLAVAVGDT